MKPVLIIIILVSAAFNCWGQDFCKWADENGNLVAAALTKADTVFGFRLQQDFGFEKNSYNSMFIHNDFHRSQNQNPKLKITFSDSWFSRDKAHHFLTSAFLSAAGYYLLREEQNYSNQKSQIGGCCFSLSLGLAKEIRDGLQQNNAFSVKDFVANLLGIAVGIVIFAD